MELSAEDQKKQELYRDARFTKQYDGIWKNVGKCVFCDLKDKYVILEENDVVLTITLFAYIDGHCMIIPRRHVRSVKELTPLEWETIRKFMYIAKKMIKKVHGNKGVQFVQKDGVDAQSTVEHIHFHAIPFDAPDLSVWNYRKLKHTPLENANLYRSNAAKITELSKKFAEKYEQKTRLEINCNLLIINKRGEVLFHERPIWAKIGNDWISPPGGMAHDLERSLEEELAREIHEETGLKLDPAKFELLSSSIEKLTRHRLHHSSGKTSPYVHQFLWNIYVLRDVAATVKLTPGDDATKLLWIPLNDVHNHPRISPGVKAAVAKVVI